MKAFLILLTASIFCSLNKSVAQDNHGDLNSVLWEITSDSSKTSYLFGTMHLMSEESFYFPDTLYDLVEASDVLVMELNGEIFDPSIMDLMLLEEGEFFDFFSDEQIDSIIIFAQEKMYLNEELFRTSFVKMKPFVVSQVFAMFQTKEEDTIRMETLSHEVALNNIAFEDSIELIGLETAKDQISLFDDLPSDIQTEMVMEQVRGSNAASGFQELTELYLTQNIDSMYSFIHDGDSYFVQFEEAFLTRRNKNWIPKISSIIKDQGAFIAVGAGHLGGPDGVIRLLREAGYTVKPIHP